MSSGCTRHMRAMASSGTSHIREFSGSTCSTARTPAGIVTRPSLVIWDTAIFGRVVRPRQSPDVLRLSSLHTTATRAPQALRAWTVPGCGWPGTAPHTAALRTGRVRHCRELFLRYQQHFVYWRRLPGRGIGMVTVLHERMHQIGRLQGDFFGGCGCGAAALNCTEPCRRLFQRKTFRRGQS